MKDSDVNNIGQNSSSTGQSISINVSESSSSESKSPLLSIETLSSATFSESQTVEPIIPEVSISDETVIYDVDIGILPDSLKQFCKDVGLDKTFIVKHFLLKAYQKTLQELEDPTEIGRKARDILRTLYISGEISSNNLEKAKGHGWLQDSDIKFIKESRKRFNQLLDKSE